MKRLLISLAAVGLSSGPGIALACDEHQHDASTEATRMMSVGSPTVIADAKPDPAAVTSKNTTARTTKKAAVKLEPMTLAAQRN